MYRRAVSLLLLPCVLLTQSAALGHAHGGSQSAGHGLRPHVHTKLLATDHRHDHSHHHHGHSGHHHHHHDDDDDVRESEPYPEPQPVPPSDHDSDAVYVSAHDAVPGGRDALADEVEAAFGVYYCLCCSAAYPTALIEDISPRAWSHPPPPGPRCPLYVRHLTLLI